jgi:predicted lipoprotein with Yx(FWY)xxD motif
MQALLKTVVAIFLIAPMITSCSKDDKDNGGTTTTPVVAKKVKVATDAKLGAVLTDSTGKSLYFFSDDATGTSTCTGGCLAAWPTFYINSDSLTIDSSLNKADFGTITHTDGTKQTTYKGWPLYYYVSDAKAGDVAGDGVGGVWFVAKPDYTVMLANYQLKGADGINYVFDNNVVSPGTGSSKYITDAYGLTLYKFASDKNGTNNFTNSDDAHNAIWPIFAVDTIKNIPSSLTRSDFTIITILGKKQLTYKGWPMYYFGSDAKVRGVSKGVSVPAPNVWPVFNTTTTTAPQS